MLGSHMLIFLNEKVGWWIVQAKIRWRFCFMDLIWSVDEIDTKYYLLYRHFNLLLIVFMGTILNVVQNVGIYDHSSLCNYKAFI